MSPQSRLHLSSASFDCHLGRCPRNRGTFVAAAPALLAAAFTLLEAKGALPSAAVSSAKPGPEELLTAAELRAAARPLCEEKLVPEDSDPDRLAGECSRSIRHSLAWRDSSFGCALASAANWCRSGSQAASALPASDSSRKSAGRSART